MVLPECALLFGGHEQQQLAHAGEVELPRNDDADTGNDDCANNRCDDGHRSVLKAALSTLAQRHSVWLVAGTIPALAPDGRVYSRCYVFDDLGQVQGYYDKLHLFDADVADGTGQYRESDTFCPGNQITVIDTPFGRLGLAICYDIRFPELFRALRAQGAELIALPAAFTAVTGQAHWQILNQARALDSQCFILAADQSGQHNSGSRETWGQSMIVSPWGEILAQLPKGTGWVQTRLTPDELTRVRHALPIGQHNRFAAPQLM